MSLEEDIPAIFLDKLSPRGLEAIKKTKKFVEEECLPADAVYFQQVSDDPKLRWTTTPRITEHLKERAKSLGLWNMFLSKHYPEGPGYTNLEYGLMAGYLGRSFVAPEATNTNAPDTGNMELFAKYGTPYHKRTWLQPLLDGKIRSAFLMTERGTSSSNALNISCSAVKNSRGNYVLNGVKWFASGAGDPRCSVWLVMCKTGNDEAKPYQNHSVLVLDAKRALQSGKVELVRPLSVYGFDDAPHGHCEIKFDNYEVSSDEMQHAVLAAEGKGFELIQSRLGPGRIHHCMRLIGVAEYALQKTVSRANHRIIFGKPMKERESFITAYARHKIDIQRSRLLVLNAAHKIDIAGAKAAMREIAMAKIDTPTTTLAALDWGVQMYGAEGVSQDCELARMWAHARTLRIADGPDEAHLNQLGRVYAKRFAEVDAAFAAREAATERLSRL
ncbi:Acyl-CoA dehydrogenase [[Candida] zeylanoides]